MLYFSTKVKGKTDNTQLLLPKNVFDKMKLIESVHVLCFFKKMCKIPIKLFSPLSRRIRSIFLCLC